MGFLVGSVTAVGALLLALAALTGVGARRRGRTRLGVVVAGAFFPLTWAVWYVSDEHPHKRSRV
jgi:hypothetical protein